MADNEHMLKLNDGVKAWNKWRRDYPDIIPDLSCEDLREVDLKYCDLHNADLTGSDFEYNDLIGCDLSRATLSCARFPEANLSNVNFSGADLCSAQFIETKGLETAICNEPALIDEHTVRYSQGLPEEFLRRIMVPQKDIPRYMMTKTQSDEITLQFNRNLWAQLFPIEKALAVTLQSDEYSIEKHSDKITIKLKSPYSIADVINAVIPMVAALESVSPGEVKAIEVSPIHKHSEIIKDDELGFIMKSFIKTAESFPVGGPLLGLWTEEFLKNKHKLPNLFAPFKAYFSGAKGIIELEHKKPIELNVTKGKELPTRVKLTD